ACAQVQHRRIGRLRDCGLRKADLQDDGEGRQEEQNKPHVRNEQRQTLPPRAGSNAGFHRVSTTPASAGHETHTRSPAAKIGWPAPLASAILTDDWSASRTL